MQNVQVYGETSRVTSGVVLRRLLLLPVVEEIKTIWYLYVVRIQRRHCIESVVCSYSLFSWLAQCEWLTSLCRLLRREKRIDSVFRCCWAVGHIAVRLRCRRLQRRPGNQSDYLYCVHVRVLVISIRCRQPEALRHYGVICDVGTDEANRRTSCAVLSRKHREAAFTPGPHRYDAMLQHSTQ